MHPAAIAQRFPGRTAVVMARTGERLSYGALAERTNRLAQLFRKHGIRRGGHVAVLLPNHLRYPEIVWAAHLTGVHLTPVGTRLTPAEAAYIINNCGAQLLISSADRPDAAAELHRILAPNVATRLMVDRQLDGWESYEAAVSTMAPDPVADPSRGRFMFYSSGTTGRPKGILRPLETGSIDDPQPGFAEWLASLGLREGAEVFLVPGPLYHSAATNHMVLLQRIGATVVLMEKFDAAEVLRIIARHKVTFGQFVPTHFVRLLRLPDAVRAAADVSSLRLVIHAAAPCPIAVKRQMLDWWGPIINEYYASTEGAGMTWITPAEWLTHPGSVGRARFGVPHILDADGNELPPGEPGDIWFSNIPPFEYHNDPPNAGNSTASRNERGYVSVGDVGYLDAEGYLYLTGRRAHTIISGGISVDPQEVENTLTRHPGVADAAVFGIPDAEFGDAVHALVEPADPSAAGPQLAAELIAFCRTSLALYKSPRSIDFTPELPRTEAGKLDKRQLREAYLHRRDA
jgi:acyl-CoA synthetase (AMP-forming)/AMP-acid ligase II